MRSVVTDMLVMCGPSDSSFSLSSRTQDTMVSGSDAPGRPESTALLRVHCVLYTYMYICVLPPCCAATASDDLFTFVQTSMLNSDPQVCTQYYNNNIVHVYMTQAVHTYTCTCTCQVHACVFAHEFYCIQAHTIHTTCTYMCTCMFTVPLAHVIHVHVYVTKSSALLTTLYMCIKITRL